MDPQEIGKLKNKRARRLATLTNTRRRALVIVNARGSRTQVIDLIKDLDIALDEVTQAHHEYMEALEDEDVKKIAQKTFEEARTSHENTVDKISTYLQERKDDPPSVATHVSRSSQSRKSGASAAQTQFTRDAEIQLRMKQLKLEQLDRQFLKEQEEDALKQQQLSEQREQERRHRRQAVEAEIEAAKLESTLRKAADDELSWDRKDDFANEELEKATNENRHLSEEQERSAGSNQQKRSEEKTKTHPTPTDSQASQGGHRIARKLPALSLHTFSDDPSDWPTWYGLFKAMIHDQPSLSMTEKMMYLQSSVSGIARQLISGMMCDPSLYPEALHTLEDRFGREQDIVQAKLDTIFSRPSPTMRSLEQFYADVNSAVTVLSRLGFTGDLTSQENLRRLVEKLPSVLRREWAKHVVSLELRPDLVEFNRWLKLQVRIALNCATVMHTSDEFSGFAKQKPRREDKPDETRVTAAFATTTRKSDCVCCGVSHDLWECPSFKAKNADERAQTVASHRCCFSCLRVGHRSRDCRSARTCGIQECHLRHHRLLHGSKRLIRFGQAPEAIPDAERHTQSEASQHTVASFASEDRKGSTAVLLQVVPVRIHGIDGKTKDTLALLDPGAQTSLCCESVLQELNITGEPQPLCLRNVEFDGEEKMSQRVQLKISPLADTEERTRLISVPEAYSVARVNVRTPTINTKNRSDWKHLQGLTIPDCAAGNVELLLGANCLEAVLQKEARVGQRGQPTAIRTAFGWSLTGSISGFLPGQPKEVMFVQMEDQKLYASLQDWWSTENFGTKFTGEVLCPEDAKAMQVLEKTTRRVGDSYEVGLLWRDECAAMPNNHKMALRRLTSLEQSLLRKPQKAEVYAETLKGYIEQGYARKVSIEEKQKPEPKRWVLPHHAVQHPEKPKPRVVFDAAAEINGVSLNTELLKGPDLLQNLCAVLLRFREERYALVADIYQMFHQIQVRPQDQPALSFLWRNLDTTKPPDMYQMRVVIFGAKCSPAIANYILRRALMENHGTGSVEVDRESLVSSFYMDDYLHSDPSLETARTSQREVTTLLSQGGFRLTKWRSNTPELLQDVKEEDRDASQKSLAPNKGEPQKALGCVWSPSTDTLSVRVKEADVPSTKRGVVQKAAMMFDPLGIISPFVLLIKCLIQVLWQKKLTWDEEMSAEDLVTWRNWLDELPRLDKLSIPRSLKSAVTKEVQRIELHMFSDASERAFAAAGYVRITDVVGHHHSALIMARSRLAPIKQLSIVRLELQAAVLAVRLATTIRKEMSYDFKRIVFWTDSQVVLQFITNESRTFRTFVANRVAEIREASDQSEWKHVPGKQNPADIASRGMSVAQLKSCDLWWRGPVFLQKVEEEWPNVKIPGLHPEQSELKRPSVKPTVSFVSDSSQLRLVEPTSYSSWTKLRRVVAWTRRFIWNVRARRQSKSPRGGSITVTELKEAEQLILCEDQSRWTLDAPNGLSLFRDESGVVRVKGRLGCAPLAEISQEPILLHPSSDITRLVISDLHERVMHSGVSHTLNQFRTRFWTPKARATVKKIVWSCARCRNRRAQPVCPKMADLPQERFNMSRPFSASGLDFLGPLTVRKFRKTEKRYILLVTCLATRSVHLEVAQAMDTDSFIMALRRFIARRGRPRCIWSDNGTNLVGGERELREALLAWNQQQITDALSQEGIEWRFNPPTASHMGGVWERLVASVKRALRTVLGQQIVSDDVLHTTIVEVEYMMNSRPLTYVSGAGNDPEALTPHHFLLGGTMASTAALPPGVFEDVDTMSRKRWRQTQALTNQVWRRWLREYLPTLIARRKWNVETPNLAVDDVVIVMAEDTPRGYWPLGVVQEVFTSADGMVRSVLVRTANGVYKRPSNKLCVLERPNAQRNCA